MKPKCLFYQYADAITIEDIKTVSFWCLILLYLIFMRELFRWLSLMFPESFYSIDGYSWDFRVPELMKKNGKAYEPEWLDQYQMNYWLQFYMYLPILFLYLLEI
jgi:hypothetical protein